MVTVRLPVTPFIFPLRASLVTSQSVTPNHVEMLRGFKDPGLSARIYVLCVVVVAVAAFLMMQRASHKLIITMDSITLEKAAVGIVGLIGLNLALKAVSHLFKTFLRPAKDLKKLGKWAVVTGATGKLLISMLGLIESRHVCC